MTVRELIKALKKEDPEALVLVEHGTGGLFGYTEEEELGASGLHRGTYRPHSTVQKFVPEGEKSTKCKHQHAAVILANSDRYSPLEV